MIVKKPLNKIVSIFLILLIMFSITAISLTPTSAATWGNEYSGTRVLQVWTNKKGATPYVTLKQTPSKYQYKNWLGKTTTKDIYKNYLVTIKPVCTVDGKKTNEKTFTKWLDSGSEKITLKKGIYYEISVKYSAVPVKLPSINGKFMWQTTWELAKTKNCANYK